VATFRQLYARRWVRYALAVLLLGLVTLRIQPQHVAHAASSTRPALLVGALLLTAPFLTIKIVRWHLMLHSAHVEVTGRESATSLLGGMGLSLLTPARLGELVRVAYLPAAARWRIGGLVMVDKAFDVLALTILSVPGAWALLGPGAGAVFGAGALAGIAIVARPEVVSTLLRRASGRFPAQDKSDQVISSLDALSARAVILFLLLTFASFAVVLIQFALLLASWKSVSASIVLLTFPIVVLTNVVPITVGGLGVREATAALLLAHYGVPGADAAVAAFLMFALNTALPGVLGALLLPAPSGAVPVQPKRTAEQP
jgi:glycosyltransferase 2 family protein